MRAGKSEYEKHKGERRERKNNKTKEGWAGAAEYNPKQTLPGTAVDTKGNDDVLNVS